MTLYFLRRLLAAVPVLFGVTVVTFTITNMLPGDPAREIAGRYATAEQVAAVRERYGFDRPLIVQYGIYLNRLARGDLGLSWSTQQSVVRELRVHLPATLELTAFAMVLTIVIGIPLGVMTGSTKAPWLNSTILLLSLVGVGIPVFWAGLIFQLVFAGQLGWLPLEGRLGWQFTPPPTVTNMYTIDALIAGQWATLQDALRHLVLPGITLAIGRVAAVARITHAAMVDVMRLDYVRTARAKGLPNRTIVYGHALRNAMLPTLTTLGLQVGFLLGGDHPGGDHLLLGRHRDVRVGRHLPARHAGHHGRHVGDHAGVHAGQPRRRSLVRRVQPEDLVRMSHAAGGTARKRRTNRLVAALKNNPAASLGLVFVFVFLLLAALPGLFGTHDPILIDLTSRLRPPSPAHPFGTDHLGMDVFTRVVYGARTTLFIVMVVLGIAVTIGTVVGAIAGYLGGWVDEILMRITDVMLAFPFLVLAIAINAALGRGLWQTMLAVGLSWWPSYARLVRGQILSVKHNEYVVAATASGCLADAGPRSARGPERLRSGPRPHHARRRLRRAHDGRPVVPRPRRRAAHAGVGPDGRRGPRLPADPVVDHDVPGPGPLRRRGRLQPPRHHRPRLARPERDQPMTHLARDAPGRRRPTSSHPIHPTLDRTEGA
jgi:ABC-type dipeptide/oligopeptide/nickel transport system permease component